MVENYFIGSLDPMHFSHYLSYVTALGDLGKVTMMIVKSDLKDNGLFTLEERLHIATNIYGVDAIAVSGENLFDHLNSAEKLVRGIRNQDDFKYLLKLASHYKQFSLAEKFYPIFVPESLRDISSTKLKNAVKNEDYDLALSMAPNEVVEMIEKKLSQMNL